LVYDIILLRIALFVSDILILYVLKKLFHWRIKSFWYRKYGINSYRKLSVLNSMDGNFCNVWY